MLDNREIAVLVWLGSFALWALSQQKLRTSLAGVFKTLLRPVILVPLMVMFGYIGVELWVGARLLLWNPSLAKSTFLWTFGSAAVLFFASTKAASHPYFFRHTLLATVGVAVFVEFFMNLNVMSLPAELALQTGVIVMGLLAAVGGLKAEHRPVRVFCETLLAVIGFALLLYTVRQTYVTWDRLDGRAVLLEFAPPIWLTVGFLPFIYVMSFYVVYDAAFRGISRATRDRRHVGALDSRWFGRCISGPAMFTVSVGIGLGVLQRPRHSPLRETSWVRSPSSAAPRRLAPPPRARRRSRHPTTTLTNLAIRHGQDISKPRERNTTSERAIGFT